MICKYTLPSQNDVYSSPFHKWCVQQRTVRTVQMQILTQLFLLSPIAIPYVNGTGEGPSSLDYSRYRYRACILSQE